MKKVLLIALPILFCLTGCMDMLNEDKDEIIEPISLQDSSGENVSGGLLNMSWPEIEILAKSVLIEKGYIEDYTGHFSWEFPDVAMVVNEKKMLKDVVVLSNTPGKEDHRYQWPEIDFEKYSLVIGHFFTSNIGYCVAKQYIVKNTLYFEIGYKYEGGFVYTSSTNNYFVALYPKLPDGQLEVKRLNAETEAVFINKN